MKEASARSAAHKFTSPWHSIPTSRLRFFVPQQEPAVRWAQRHSAGKFCHGDGRVLSWIPEDRPSQDALHKMLEDLAPYIPKVPKHALRIQISGASREGPLVLSAGVFCRLRLRYVKRCWRSGFTRVLSTSWPPPQ